MDYCDEHDIMFIKHSPSAAMKGKSGIFFAKVRASQLGAADLIVARPRGDIVAVETKTLKGKQREGQVRWQARWEEKGHKYFLIRSLNEFVLAL